MPNNVVTPVGILTLSTTNGEYRVHLPENIVVELVVL